MDLEACGTHKGRMSLQDTRQALAHAEINYRQAARIRQRGVPNDVAYESALHSLLAAYESHTMKLARSA